MRNCKNIYIYIYICVCVCVCVCVKTDYFQRLAFKRYPVTLLSCIYRLFDATMASEEEMARRTFAVIKAKQNENSKIDLKESKKKKESEVFSGIERVFQHFSAREHFGGNGNGRAAI